MPYWMSSSRDKSLNLMLPFISLCYRLMLERTLVMYTVFRFPVRYNLSAILPKASASLLRTPIKLLTSSFRCSRSSWKFTFWDSSWALSIFAFFSSTSTNWFCRLTVSSSSSVASLFRFRPSWEVDPISRFEAGSFSFVVPADGKKCHEQNIVLLIQSTNFLLFVSIIKICF